MRSEVGRLKVEWLKVEGALFNPSHLAVRPTLNLELSTLNFSFRPVSAPEFNIKYVAHLARLKLSPEEETQLAAQLGNILGYIEKLKEVDVTGVEPTAHAFPMVNVFRADETRPSLSNEDALRNAPKKTNGLFVVPKVVE